MVGLPDGEKKLKIHLLVSANYTKVIDEHPEGMVWYGIVGFNVPLDTI